MQKLRILYQDEHVLAVDKPAGLQVHPPERDFGPKRFGPKSPGKDALHLARDQIGKYVYPIHRLDRATSGVLLFALDSHTASLISQQFAAHTVRKQYVCLLRGWLERPERVERPLSDVVAVTEFEIIHRFELPQAVGRYPTARYTLAWARPETGRYHQIRRHAAGIGHPIVGDSEHGDPAHNRLFRTTLNIPGLLLKAYSLAFAAPNHALPLVIQSKWTGAWHRLFELCGVCAVDPAVRACTPNRFGVKNDRH